jgi:hypothetical protein
MHDPHYIMLVSVSLTRSQEHKKSHRTEQIQGSLEAQSHYVTKVVIGYLNKVRIIYLLP